jgi:TolB-like protein
MKKLWLVMLSVALPVIFAAQDIRPQSAVKKRDTVSVLYFENTAGNAEYDWLSKGIADMLITDVAASGAVDVVERNSLSKVLKEQELALTG